MSHLIITQSPTTRVVLPIFPGFKINPVRLESSRTAVAGNVIRQVSTIHASTAVATYSGPVERSKADTLATMHETSSNVRVFFRNRIYDAVMSFDPGDFAGRNQQVRIRLGIVREIP